jgi:hypothetical protein
MSAALDRHLDLEWAWVEDALPRVLPAGWRLVQVNMDGFAWAHRNGIYVIASGAVEQDGRRWLHVSLSRQDRLPSWADIREVKNVFVGSEALAVQVLPPESRYINIHAFVLHLWRCVDGDPVPDFARGGKTI